MVTRTRNPFLQLYRKRIVRQKDARRQFLLYFGMQAHLVAHVDKVSAPGPEFPGHFDGFL